MYIISIYLKTKFIYIYLTFFYLPDCTPTLHLKSSQRVFQRNLIHTNILSKAYQSYHCLLHVPRFIFCYPITSIIYSFIYLFIICFSIHFFIYFYLVSTSINMSLRTFHCLKFFSILFELHHFGR